MRVTNQKIDRFAYVVMSMSFRLAWWIFMVSQVYRAVTYSHAAEYIEYGLIVAVWLMGTAWAVSRAFMNWWYKTFPLPEGWPNPPRKTW